MSDSTAEPAGGAGPRLSPLDGCHRELHARMVPFGGWDMPLQYPSGTLEEHRLCRTAAVAFDVSHLGTVRVQGPRAFAELQRVLTNDLRKISSGRAQYTHMLNADDGSVTDDIIVWWRNPEVFDVMPNASNTARVTGALELDEGAGLEVEDITSTRAVVAVQGPMAREHLASVSPEAAAVGRFRVTDFTFEGVSCTAAGTGYTGEDGVECAVPAPVAEAFWKAVLGTGVAPAGLGARDTLRLEAALPLHGHELGAGISPLNAGLGWVIGWDKGEFVGRSALEAQRSAGVNPVLRGLRCAGRRPPRADQSVLVGEKQVGRVTSGNFSPMLECGIALALVDPGLRIGDGVTIDMRGTLVEAEVVELPFWKG